MSKSLALRRQRAALIEEMHDLTNDGGAWRTASPDSKAARECEKRFTALDSDQKELQRKIAKLETDDLDEEMRQVIKPPMPQVGAGYPGYVDQRATAPQTEYSASRELQPYLRDLESREYKQAFGRFLRGGGDALTTEQRNMLVGVSAEVRTYAGLNTSTSGDAGGYSVPLGFQRELEKKMKAIGRMRSACRILNTATGNTMDWPTFDDSSNEGEFLAEANPVTQVNPTFNQIQFNAYLASSKQVLISLQLVQDSAFALEDVLAEAFAIRIGRIVNEKYTNGSGSSEPQGLVYAIKNDAVPNVVKATGSNTNDGVSGNTEANSIGTDDLENLISAVDPAYRAGSIFMFKTSTIDFLRKVKDKYGRPVWSAGLTDGTPDRILGYGFEWNESMDAIGANKYPALFGSFAKHCIRDAGGFTMAVYRELYLPNHQYGYQAWLRTDSRRLQQSAFSLLWNPLS